MDNLKYPLQFDLTLKRLSMTALLAYIFEHPDITEKMKETIHTEYMGPSFLVPVKSIKKEIIKLASKKINALDLPKNLISETQGMLIFFAKKMAVFAEFALSILQVKMPYMNRIYWTFLGTIDEAKIYDDYWRNRKRFPEILMPDVGISNRQFIAKKACKYANEEIILALQNSMIKELQKFLKPVILPNIKNKIDQVMASYSCYFFGKMEGLKDDYQKEIYKKFKQTGKVNISEALFLCIGNSTKCIKFLWGFLNDVEKEKIVIQLACQYLHQALFYSCDINFHPDMDLDTDMELISLAGQSETLLFLINQMSPEQRNQFLTGNVSGVMQLFLQSWPYPEICIKMFKEEYVCESISFDGDDVLYTLVFRMARDLIDLANVSGTCQYPRVFHELLKKILSLVSKGVKEQVFFDQAYYYAMGKAFAYAIEHFYYIFDLNALSIIINDNDLKDKREVMITMGCGKISKLIKKGNWKSVISFMEKVLISKEERKQFIEEWDLKNRVLAAKNPDIREKIMNWLRD